MYVILTTYISSFCFINITKSYSIRQYLIPLKELLKYKKDGAVWNALLFPVAQNSDVPGARQRDALKCLYVIGGLGT